MQITCPDLGVDKGEIIELLVQVGDTVQANQSLLLVESSKASVEVPSPSAGVITAILVQVGQTIAEHVVLFELQAAAAPASQVTVSEAAVPERPASAAPAQNSPAAAPAQNPVAAKPSASHDSAFSVPDLGVDQAEVIEVLVKVGDTVTLSQSVAVVESSKASVEIPSPAAGLVTQWALTLGQQVQAGAPLMSVRVAGVATADAAVEVVETVADLPAHQLAAPVDKSAPVVDNSAQAVDKSNQSAPVLVAPIAPAAPAVDVYAGPAVRRVARQLGVNLLAVQGSGPHGRVLKDDVYGYVKQQLATPKTAPVAPSTSPSMAHGLPPLPDLSAWGVQHIEQLTRLQQAAVAQLSLNNYIPQVTQFDEADISELEALRNSLKDKYKKQGTSLTILAFIAKAVAHLLLQERRFNSHLADDGKSIVVRDEVHLGIAVATPDGLIVPVLRHPDQKGIAHIAQELQELGQKARDKKLKPSDLAGASFTISSLGNLGGTGFTPLVNWPQVAILGVSPARMQPVWNGESFVPRLLLPLSLSYDHRVINGADAAGFARRLAETLADLRHLLL